MQFPFHFISETKKYWDCSQKSGATTALLSIYLHYIIVVESFCFWAWQILSGHTPKRKNIKFSLDMELFMSAKPFGQYGSVWISKPTIMHTELRNFLVIFLLILYTNRFFWYKYYLFQRKLFVYELRRKITRKFLKHFM